MSTLQEAEGKLVTMRHVVLVESDPFAIGFSDIFDWGAACCGEAVRNFEFFGCLDDGRLAKMIIDLVDTHGGEANWSRDLVTEDCSCRIPLASINEHTTDNPVAIGCLAIGKMCIRLTSNGGCIIPMTDSIEKRAKRIRMGGKP